MVHKDIGPAIGATLEVEMVHGTGGMGRCRERRGGAGFVAS